MSPKRTFTWSTRYGARNHPFAAERHTVTSPDDTMIAPGVDSDRCESHNPRERMRKRASLTDARGRSVAVGLDAGGRPPRRLDGGPRSLAALVVCLAALVPSCGTSPPTVVVTGMLIAHPENDCRYSHGSVRPVLAGVRIVVTSLPGGIRSVTRSDSEVVNEYPPVCRQTGRFTIEVPVAKQYRIQVVYYSVFGGIAAPVTVSYTVLERNDFRVTVPVRQSTGE